MDLVAQVKPGFTLPASHSGGRNAVASRSRGSSFCREGNEKQEVSALEMADFKCPFASTEKHLSREPQLRDWLHQFGLWADLEGGGGFSRLP